jgi:hypothetical protein
MTRLPLKRSALGSITWCGVLYWALCWSSTGLQAQSASPEMREVLQRLQRLEDDNRTLTGEIRALRSELAVALGKGVPSTAANAPVNSDNANPGPTNAEHLNDDPQVSVNKARIDELAQTKVEASQKLPLQVVGMALFNAYVNGRYNAGAENTTVASLGPGDATGGGTLRQTVLGLQYESPQSVLGARITGSLFTDFFAGTGASLDHILRLRTATVTLDWGSTAVTVGQDKPIISPRDPGSYAQVGVSPLTGAGNLWLWQPQARIEERFRFGTNSGVKAQLGVFQTRELGAESAGYNPYLSEPTQTVPVEHADPGIEGRFEFWRQWGENIRIEIAPGFHDNASHAGASSIPTHIFSTDWLIKPSSYLEFSGFFYNGQNVATLGALPQGFVMGMYGQIHPVHSTGGWAQLRIPVTPRLAFDFYGGTQDDRNTDLSYGYIGANRAYFANAQYRIAPNVILSLEGGQVRTQYLGPGLRVNNHYDLAVAYLF